MGYAYPIDSKVVTNPNGTIDYDRASSSAQLRGLIKSMITNGVNLTESTNLQVMADEETMNVTVKPGHVIIEGAVKYFEDDVKVKIADADTTNSRIDTIVARLNLNEDVRDIVIDVLQGTPSAEPVAPELSQNTSTYYEVGLADILVEVGTTQISQASVTDTRLLNSRCGMISAIGEIDTETLFNQLTTDFDNWFESIKGKLGDDVAGGLQIQIDGLADDIDTLQEDAETLTTKVETLENTGCDNLIWDISENLYAESRDVSTLPRDISTGYAIKFKGELYIIGGQENKTTYKYDNGEWVNPTGVAGFSIVKNANNRGNTSLSNNGGVVANDNMIYCTNSTTDGESACLGTIYISDGTQKSSTRMYYGVYNSNYMRHGNIAIAATGNVYKTISLGYNGTTPKGYMLMVGSASEGAYTPIISDNDISFYEGSVYISQGKKVRPMCQGVYFKGEPTFLISIREFGSYKEASTQYFYDFRYCLIILDSSDKIKETIELPCHEILVTDMVCINGYIYITYVNGTVYRYREKWERVEIGNGSLVEHNGEIHRFYGTTHTAHKLYKIAKTYAPKGSKIYLPYESKALSDNLVAIDGGYLVTESGNVSIAMYDY